jgi:anti-anti-sigma regulatory factor
MKEHGGKVRLVHVHKKVSALLKISMLDRLFDIQESTAKH